jgi:hypothetical protein
MDNPFYAVCKLGPSRFFWVAWPAENIHECYDRPIGHGYAAIEAAAITAALALTETGAKCFPKGWAANYHRKIAAQRRTEKLRAGPSADTGAAPAEYLYNRWWDNEDCETRYAPHRIIKKTKRRIFIDREDAQRGEWYAKWVAEHSEDLRTIALDRATLERDGKASSGRGYFNDYYTKEAMEREIADRERARGLSAPCITALGLSWPCTLADVKRTWRELARKLHPDHGGDADAFRDMRSHYEAALQLVGGAR